MAAPWEKYATQKEGPWSKYDQAATNDPADYPQGKSATEADKMRNEFYRQEASTKTKIKDTAARAVPYIRPIVEGLGAVGGAIVGAPAAVPTMGLSSIAGGATGYAAGKYLMDMAEGRPQSAGQTLADLGTGATFEMGGMAAAPALSALSKGVGYVAKPLLGKMSGVGKSAIDEALQSGAKSANEINPLKSATAFDKALRGQITGEEVVDNARSALNQLKESRATAYQNKLQQITAQQGNIDTRPIKGELQTMMNRYNVKVDPVTGKIDTSRIAMGKTGANDVKEIVEKVSSWGSQPGDNTAIGLDTLKRQLDDFYSDSSQARQFVAQMRDMVKSTIVNNIPMYDDMTKGYSEATKLIKDIESGLMMRKQGMSGRITADQTLKRLTSAMNDNQEMRKELVELLGTQGNKDLTGQVAGLNMNTPVPRGLAGTGPSLAVQGYMTYLNPKLWPVLAASSPRVQGEFLRLFGKGMKQAGKIPKEAVRAGVRQTAISASESD